MINDRVGSARGWATRRAATHCGATGTVAAAICMLTCCLPPILVALGIGASAGGMAGMSHTGHGSEGTLGALLQLLHRITPGLLIVSIILIAGALALRRPLAAVPALLAGAVLYFSVHIQPDPAVMFAGLAVGYGSWIGLYFWTRPAKPAPTATAHCG